MEPPQSYNTNRELDAHWATEFSTDFTNEKGGKTTHRFFIYFFFFKEIGSPEYTGRHFSA